MKATKWAVAALAIFGTGCASLPKMDRSLPIEMDHGFFAARYKQDGQAIDPGDVRDQLQREPEAASDASRGQVLRFISTMAAGVGGALVGVPLGQAAAGEGKPVWPLAVAGAGAITVSIPLAVWADSSMDSAVEAHNQRVAADLASRAALAGPGAPGRRATRGAPPARLEAFGFVLGASVISIAEACRQAGHEWGAEDGGSPAPSTIRVRFTPGRQGT